MINEIHNGSWEKILPKIQEDTVDLIVTSPPYNIDLGQSDGKSSYETHDDNMPYEAYLSWIKDLFIQCNRVLKHGGRMCINIADGANGSIPTHAHMISTITSLFRQRDAALLFDQYDGYEPFDYITTIVWDKLQMGSSTAWGSWQSPSCPSFPTQFEYILIAGKGTKKHEGDKDKVTVSKDNFIRNSRALWKFNPENKMKEMGHPAMFPEELPCRLIDQLSYEGDVVLDPFNGLGTTTCVAKRMGRQYIGIEKSKHYYDKSLVRMGAVPDVIDGTPSWMI
jgi:DNA modification methylase